MNSETGSRLGELRRDRGISQEQLAERIGVSRQAVSNWERGEALPDTANLIKLAELFEVALDEMTGRRPREAQADHPAPTMAGEVAPRDRRVTWAWFTVTALLAFAYYTVVCQPLLLTTVDDISLVFDLELGPALATVWFCAEVAFVLVPFLVLAALPVRGPRGIWAAPLAAFLVPSLIAVAAGALGGAWQSAYPGIGGALVSSIALKADLLALISGCMLVAALDRRQRTEVVRPG